MNKTKFFITLMIIAGAVIFTRCNETRDVCPDGMKECNANGNTICVPKSVGC